MTLNLCSLVVALLLALVTDSFAQTKVKPSTEKRVAARNLVMCETMPGAEVASKAPFTLPFKSAEMWPTAATKTGCKYTFKNDAEEAGVAIGLTDLGTKENASISYNNAYQASKDLWGEAPAAVVALRNTGFFSGKDECGLKFHLDRYILDINFKGQFSDVSDEKKKAAGIALAEIVMERLSHLWNQGSR